jgi:ABC-type transport system substrate-binding protein
MRPPPRAVLLGALALGVAVLSGCGSDGSIRSGVSSPPAAGGNGSLAYAIPAAPGSLDPLSARSLSAQTVSLQIFEPLIASLHGPYGRRRSVPGAVLAAQHSGDSRVWSLRLRPGIRFQDGRLLDASAVLANAERWRSLAAGRRVLPGLIAADGPRPDLVRFVFANPVSDLPRRLAVPALGLVSPSALRPQSGAGARLRRVTQAGSGPFELVGRTRGGLILRRNRSWWGSAHGLGPALDEVTFRLAPSRRTRVDLLRGGAVRVAADLGPAAARRLRSNPLLTAVSAASPHALGLERSVRGIDSWPPASLSSTWLTVIVRP